MPFELVVIELRHRHGSHGKDGIEPADSLLVLDFLNRAVFGGSDVRHVCQDVVDVSLVAAIGLLIEVVEDIGGHIADALRRHEGLFTVDIVYLFVVDVRFLVHRLDIIDAEGQHVLVVDRVHDRVGVQLVAECLFRGGKARILDVTGVCREDRRSCEAEDVILLKILDNRGVHIAELAAVAFVEDDDDVLLIHRMSLVLIDKGRELLNGRDNDPRVVVFELLFQNCCRGVGIGGAFFKAVIFLHGLVVEVFSVDDEQHLVNGRQGRGEPRGLEARERFARACCMPYITAAGDGAVLFVVGGDLNAVEDAFCRRDLIRAHDHQHVFRGKNAVPRQDIEQRMLGEKGFGKVDQVGDNAVVRVSPEGGELKAVGGFALLSAILFIQSIPACRVGIILRVRAV